MDRSKLNSLLEEHKIDRLILEEEVTSTNDVAKSLAWEGFSGRALIIAEKQTAGRGRLGRNWSSPAGTGIWMSLLDTEVKNLGNISGITLLAGLSVAETVNEYTNSEQVLIKWPNDLVIHGKKICGILTELVSSGDSGSLIIGIGINACGREFPEELKDKATSILLETGSAPDREKIVTDSMARLTDLIKVYNEAGSLEFIRDRYQSLMVNRDKEIVLSSQNGDFYDNPYIARGIDEEGNLIVEDKNGKKSAVRSGEISVRGVLGYV